MTHTDLRHQESLLRSEAEAEFTDTILNLAEVISMVQTECKAMRHRINQLHIEIAMRDDTVADRDKEIAMLKGNLDRAYVIIDRYKEAARKATPPIDVEPSPEMPEGSFMRDGIWYAPLPPSKND
jgi:hypothetical protein